MAFNRSAISERINGNEGWEKLKKAISLSRNERQKTYRNANTLIKVLLKGLGSRRMGREWAVGKEKDGTTYVAFSHGHKNHRIYGFKGLEKVHSIIEEKDGQIIASFYKDRISAKKGIDVIKIAVLSKKVDGNWTILEKPEVLFSSETSIPRKYRDTAKELRDFLRSDQPRGASINVGPLCVRNGSISLTVDTKGDKKTTIQLGGFAQYEKKKLVGRIMAEGNVKRAYIWRSKRAMNRGEEPILPKGQAVAWVKKGNGSAESGWEIKYCQLKDVIKKTEDSFKYGNYLFSTAGHKTYIATWPVYRVKYTESYTKTYTRKSIRWNRVSLDLPFLPPDIKEVTSVTREIRGRIKLVEFWPTLRDYTKGERPFAARFVTFKPDGKSWEFFWVRLDDVKAFKRLVRNGAISQEELNAITADNYLVEHYSDEICRLVDYPDRGEYLGKF